MMRRRIFLIVLLLLLSLAGFAPAGLSELSEDGKLSEWTVMIYMCGADLESSHGMGSYNLREIAGLWFPKQVVRQTEGGAELVEQSYDQVNVLVETGGAKSWHGMDVNESGISLGVNISADRLQRYRFDVSYNEEKDGYTPALRLLEEQPLANMADPETLSDFIGWAKRKYPAKKYALVLWGHGGGSATGLIVDELFDNDIMYLYELERALQAGGAIFEMVALDACLMCSLETAQVLAPYAAFMVASEELSSGYGSAFGGWVYELFRAPKCSGGLLGSWYCDATQEKYVKSGDLLAETRLTCTVIYLGAINRLAECFDRLFEFAGDLYQTMPERFNMFINQLTFSETYGTGNEDMIDLGSFLYDPITIEVIDSKCRDELADAMELPIYYTVRGSGRVKSRGISFCFSPNMTADEMEIYAQNCKSPHYLALLDAMNPGWSAPEWVYEAAERLPQIEEMEEYQMPLELIEGEGLPRLHVTNRENSMLDCKWRLYFLNEATGEIGLLGEDVVLAEWDDVLGDLCYTIDKRGRWPAIEGKLCCVELVKMEDDTYIYNAPVQFETGDSNMRIRGIPVQSKDSTALEYEAMGLWQGYDRDNRMPNRTLIGLQMRQGWEYRLLYPVWDMQGNETHRVMQSEPLTMYRTLDIEEMPLPRGTYYFCYVVRDICHRTHRTNMIRLNWDGTSFSAVQ